MKEAVYPHQEETASIDCFDTPNIRGLIDTYYSEAVQDGRNMAALYLNLRTGLNTFYKVFSALEAKYEPFFTCDFTASFYDEMEVQNASR